MRACDRQTDRRMRDKSHCVRWGMIRKTVSWRYDIRCITSESVAFITSTRQGINKIQQEFRTYCQWKLFYWQYSRLCLTSAPPTQRTTIVNNKLRTSHSVYNSWQHRRRDDGRARSTTAEVWRQVEQKAILIYAHILYFKPKYIPRAAFGEGSDCGSRVSDANFLIKFYSNYGSILPSFRDMTRTADDGWRTDNSNHRISGPHSVNKQN